MGVKRKAGDPLSPCSPSTSSMASQFHNPAGTLSPGTSFLVLGSPSSSTPSGWNSPEPYFASGMLASSPHSPFPNINHHHHQSNSRTRKRFRDNRPDEDIIHQTTLSKLYAAQRPTKQCDNQFQPNPPPTPAPSPPPSASLTSPFFDLMDSTTSSATEDPASDPITIQDGSSKSQTSLHAFFGHTSTTTTSATFKSSHPTFRVLGRDAQSLPSNFHSFDHGCSVVNPTAATQLNTDTDTVADTHADADADMMDVEMDVNTHAMREHATTSMITVND